MSLLSSLEFIWFGVVVILLTGYAILDGFDLGVGMLHLFSKKDEERRLMLNSIGPVWDGNEVWLVTAGGAIFAGFPHVYATFCSAFYVPIMILLSGLIFRAVAIEFRSKQPMAWWRWSWDGMFTFASFLIALASGIIMGNLVKGIPIDANKETMGTFADLLNPYALLVGVMTVALFAMHGSIYIVMKTEGAFHDKMRGVGQPRHHQFHHVVCDHDGGDADLYAAYDGYDQGAASLLPRRYCQHVGHRQYPPRDLPRTRWRGVCVLLPEYRVFNGPVWHRHIP